jgi:hypothetical protein
MGVPKIRNVVCWALIVLMPSFVMGGGADAMINCKGTVLVNGNSSPNSSAIATGDTVQTEDASAATITASGSSIILQPESLVKFATSTISLQQGSISVASSTGLVTAAGMATVTPAASAWTEYEVSNSNGNIEVLDRKGDLKVDCGKDNVALSDGMQVTSDASGHCSKHRPKGAYPPASGSILSNPYLPYVAGAAGAGTLIWLLWPHPHQPVSAAQP